LTGWRNTSWGKRPGEDLGKRLQHYPSRPTKRDRNNSLAEPSRMREDWMLVEEKRGWRETSSWVSTHGGLNWPRSGKGGGNEKGKEVSEKTTVDLGGGG